MEHRTKQLPRQLPFSVGCWLLPSPFRATVICSRVRFTPLLARWTRLQWHPFDSGWQLVGSYRCLIDCQLHQVAQCWSLFIDFVIKLPSRLPWCAWIRRVINAGMHGHYILINNRDPLACFVCMHHSRSALQSARLRLAILFDLVFHPDQAGHEWMQV